MSYLQTTTSLSRCTLMIASSNGDVPRSRVSIASVDAVNEKWLIGMQLEVRQRGGSWVQLVGRVTDETSESPLLECGLFQFLADSIQQDKLQPLDDYRIV